MEVKIVFNSESLSNEFSIGWGISLLIDGHILFDTGENGDYLLNNLKKLNVDLAQLKSVVISHHHWDHTGGLWEILNKRKGIEVYACPGFDSEFKEKVKTHEGKLIEAKSFSEIARNIYLTGEISGIYNGSFIAEQAIVLKTGKGLTVITGCAHPGIVKMLGKVKEKFPEERFYLVFGGFHLAGQDKRTTEMVVGSFKEMEIEKVGPTHCTGKDQEAIFKEIYKDDCLSIKVGQIIEV